MYSVNMWQGHKCDFDGVHTSIHTWSYFNCRCKILKVITTFWLWNICFFTCFGNNVHMRFMAKADKKRTHYYNMTEAYNPSVIPGLWSPCHLCGRSKCCPSTQSSAAASSWLNSSAVSWASQPSAASPWTWRSVVSPARSLPLQVSRSWIVLPNTTREQLVKVSWIAIPRVLCHSRSRETLSKHQRYTQLQQNTSSFLHEYVSAYQGWGLVWPIFVLHLYSFRLKGNCRSELTSFLWKVNECSCDCLTQITRWSSRDWTEQQPNKPKRSGTELNLKWNWHVLFWVFGRMSSPWHL